MSFTYRLLRVDLSRGETWVDEIPGDVLRRFIGGRGLGAYLAMKEIPKGADPFGPENVVYILTGPLTGVTVMSGRYHVVAKSPKTGILGDSNSGGHFGPWLRFAGFDGIAIHGKSDTPVYLWINDGKVEIRDASKLWGKTVSATEDALRREHGLKEGYGSVLTIGPAGENLALTAAIMNDKWRAAGRTGLAAVLGAKKLKAIVAYGKKRPPIADRKTFAEENRRLTKIFLEGPTSKSLHEYGTAVLVNIINSLGGFSSYYWEEGIFDDAYEISGEKLAETYLVDRVGCWGCTIRCARVSKVPTGAFKVPRSEGPEYESIWALGALTGTSDIAAVVKLNYLANDLGFDTISLGNSLAFAVYLAKKGLIPEGHLEPYDLRWGNAESLVELMYRAAVKADPLAAAVADGVPALAEAYNAEDYAVHVRNLELPAYDPRALKSMALSYATSNRGGCHLRSYTVAAEALGIPKKMDPLEVSEEKVDLAIWMQDWFSVIDSLVICKFVAFDTTPDDWVKIVNAITGWDATTEELLTTGARIYNLERLFAVREGKWVKDYLPKRLLEEPIPRGPAKGHTAKDAIEKMLPAYWEKRGWVEGRPKRETLLKLGLDEFADLGA
ncbi:aldehyde ferredoxin oxidoreductase family protein [Stetteria hydrogenophila]